MRLIAGYITRQVAKTTCTALLIMVVAFILERTLRLIRTLGVADMPLDLAAGMLASRLPEILSVALPPALFAGVLLTFQRMARDRELDVIYASGIGLLRLMRPVLGLTGIVAAVAVLVFWFLLPHSKYQFRAMLHEASQVTMLSAPVQTGSFVQFDGKVLYIQAAKEGGESLERIFFFDPVAQGEKSVTTALTGGFGTSPDQHRLYLIARDGQRISLPELNDRPSRLNFDYVRTQIFSIDQPGFRARGEDRTELTLPELWTRVMSAEQIDADPALSAQLHTKLARILFILLLPFAAVPLALALPVARQWAGMAIGAFLVLAIDQALILGETLAGQGRISPWIGTWGALVGLLMITIALAGILVIQRARVGQASEARHRCEPNGDEALS